MDIQQAINNLQQSIDREADLADEAVEMAIDALRNQIIEIPREAMEAAITGIPINQGGYPKYMLNESIMPTVDLLDNRLNLQGIRIAFVKTETQMDGGDIDYNKTVEMIHHLQSDGVHLTDITEELDYRDRANDAAWDDNLYVYTTKELADIEELWCEVEPASTESNNASDKVHSSIVSEIKCTRSDCEFNYLDGCSYGGSEVQISELGCLTFEPAIDGCNVEDSNIHKAQTLPADVTAKSYGEEEYMVLCVYDVAKGDGESTPQSVIIRVIAASPDDAISKVDNYDVENMFDNVDEDYIEDSLYSVRCI